MGKSTHLLPAIITGASSGIGAATAQALAAKGWPVILTARRVERLEQLAAAIQKAGGTARVVAADLAQPEGRQALFAACPDADILVNNAGFGWYGFAERMPWELAREMIEINVAATVQLSLLYLPGMRARRRGHMINIGSIAGSLPNQGIAMVAASKAFLDAFSTSIYRELRGSGVEISVVRPGPVKTEFFDLARRQAQGGSIPAERFAVPAETVARSITRLIAHPRRVAYVPWYMSLTPLLEQWFGGIIDRLGPLLLGHPKFD